MHEGALIQRAVAAKRSVFQRYASVVNISQVSTVAGSNNGIIYIYDSSPSVRIVQELCESRGGRPGLSVLTSLLVSVDVKIY